MIKHTNHDMFSNHRFRVEMKVLAQYYLTGKTFTVKAYLSGTRWSVTYHGPAPILRKCAWLKGYIWLQLLLYCKSSTVSSRKFDLGWNEEKGRSGAS